MKKEFNYFRKLHDNCLGKSKATKFLYLGGFTLLLVVSLLLSLCCYLRFSYPRASAEEIFFALKAPAGDLAFIYVRPMLMFFVAPLVFLLVSSLAVWRYFRAKWFSILLILLTVAAFFFARYEIKSTRVIEFIQNQSKENYTTFIEDNYVDPKDASLHFPKKKRNLSRKR